MEMGGAAVSKVAALFVDPKGVYSGLPDVDVWDEARDARNYRGPWPVVAHPPCARWCMLAPLVQSMFGYEVGDDEGCFEAALEAVRTFGGVLEHPAGSKAWKHFGLPRPVRYGWTSSFADEGFTTELAQVAYGHPARKRTWLYAVGCELPALDWREPPAAVSVSDFGPGNCRHRGEAWREKSQGVQYAEASATPPAFAAELVAMARTARKHPSLP